MIYLLVIKGDFRRKVIVQNPEQDLFRFIEHFTKLGYSHLVTIE